MAASAHSLHHKSRYYGKYNPRVQEYTVRGPDSGLRQNMVSKKASGDPVMPRPTQAA